MAVGVLKSMGKRLMSPVKGVNKAVKKKMGLTTEKKPDPPPAYFCPDGVYEVADKTKTGYGSARVRISDKTFRTDEIKR